jgi:hypothetical protein
MTDNRRVLLATVLVLGLVVGLTMVSGAEPPPGGSFVDDDGNVHEGQIEAIAAEGITKGCNPPARDRYCPNDPVTRAQMASFLVRMLNLADATDDHFTDDEESIHRGDIDRLASAGITRGCNPPANDRYCPDEPVTREQMASFLARALNLRSASRDHFTDDGSSVHHDSINRLAESGITRGCNPPANTSYCPSDPVRRDQMASFLARALGLQPITPPPPESTTTSQPGSSEPPDTTTTTVSSSDQLLMSVSSDRSDPEPFGGQITGNIYPFVHPAGPVRQVQFYLDDPAATGTPFQIESEAPFDMGGTVNPGEAAAFRSTRLTNGSHTITVEIIRDSEPNVVDHYPITVSNSTSLVFDPIAANFTLNPGESQSAAFVVGTNNGSSTSFTVGAIGPEWLSVHPMSGSSGATLMIEVDANGLGVGVYETTVMTFASGYRAGELPVRLVIKAASEPNP